MGISPNHHNLQELPQRTTVGMVAGVATVVVIAVAVGTVHLLLSHATTIMVSGVCVLVILDR